MYVGYLMRKILFAKCVMVFTAILAWFAVFDLAAFARYGTSLIHPVLDVFFIITSVLLLLVAVSSAVTSFVYLARVTRQSR